MQPMDDAPPSAKAIVQFLPAWTELVSGQLRAGASVLVEYDPTRLLGGRSGPAEGGSVPSEVFAHVRIHPGGRELTCSLLWHAGGGEAPALERAEPWVHDLEIPPDATELELWFRVTYADGSTDWDTRYGANYRFAVAPAAEPATIPAQSVGYRWGAVPRLDLVHIVSERVAKERIVASPHAISVQTRLFVQAWTESHLPDPRSTWVDIHVFDEGNQLVHSETLPLERLGPAEAGGELHALDRPIYEGSSLVAPGSVARSRSEAVRKLQYRLYHEANGQIFTDGLLHQHDLVPDSATQA